MTDDPWGRLLAALDRWHAEGRVARFWLRDDDAGVPTPALDRLLDLSGRHAVPLTLAVIPADSGSSLAERLTEEPLASVAVHGWSHRNYAGADQKKQELGPQRPADVVLGELGAGFRHLRDLHDDRFVPVLVPPWNRVSATLLPSLPEIGFAALSVFGPEKPGPIRCINTHVDLIDWHGSRGGRPAPALIDDILSRLDQMSEGGGDLGFLTHHLVHDAAAWEFLEQLLAATAAHPACRWTSLADMLEQG